MLTRAIRSTFPVRPRHWVMLLVYVAVFIFLIRTFMPETPAVQEDPVQILPASTAFPVTFEGRIEMSVESADIDWCSLRLPGSYLLLELPNATLRSSGLSRSEIRSADRLRVTLSGPSDLLFSDESPYYTVAAIERPDAESAPETEVGAAG